MPPKPSTPLERTHLMLAPALCNIFEVLRLGAALTDGKEWSLIHMVPNVETFELAHGLERHRDAHNSRSIAKAQKSRKPVISPHAGFHDLYVPVPDSSKAVLVTGPFSVARPTSAEMRERWRWLTRNQPRVADPEFAQYLSMTLATTTFDQGRLALFERFAGIFCSLLSGKGDADRLATEVSTLREKLSSVRFADHVWETAASMVDERNFRVWSSPHFSPYLEYLGLTHPPAHAVVGLLTGKRDEGDPIDDLLRRDAFLRAGVDFARKAGHVLAGRVGEFGVALLVDDVSKGPRLRAKLLDTGERFRSLARRHGLRLHLGLHAPDDPGPLPARYQAALGAAEKALSGGLSFAFAEPSARGGLGVLGQLRRDLAADVRNKPASLTQRFDRYMDAVAVHSGYQLDSIQAHLETGFDEVVEALGGATVLDEQSLTDLRSTLERAAGTGTVRDLLLAYRGVVSDLESTVLKPKTAQHERSLKRALTFIRQHATEQLSLPQVAKIAGFAPSYFSKLFAETEKTTFQRYVQALRVERARSMLESTTLGVERVGQLSGFGTRTRFHLAFKQALRMTPAEYRARQRDTH